MANEEKEKIVCHRCGYTAEKGDKHCVLCGAPLENRCMDEPGLVHSGCGAKNEPHAAFCVKCGYPTLFNHHGIVKPHPSAAAGTGAHPFSNGFPFPISREGMPFRGRTEAPFAQGQQPFPNGSANGINQGAIPPGPGGPPASPPNGPTLFGQG